MRKNVLGYFRNLGSLRYWNEYCIGDAVWEKLLFSTSPEAFFNHAVELLVHWFVQCYKMNQWLGGYINAATSQISLKEATEACSS